MVRVLGRTIICVACGCGLAQNYDDPDGPRYAGNYAVSPPPARADFLVVTYNLEYAIEVDTAIAALSTPPLAGADVILMQEMDAAATERIAAALSLAYVYYPSSVHRNGRDFGAAILTLHPIVADHKLILPHLDPGEGRLRTATAAVLDVAGTHVGVWSVHLSTVLLGLGARLEQAQTMIDDAAPFAGPAIAGGDFNTTDPTSADQTIAMFEDAQWAWSSAGTRDSVDTAAGSLLLDFVFARGLAAHEAGVFRGDAGSDHRPVWARLEAP